MVSKSCLVGPSKRAGSGARSTRAMAAARIPIALWGGGTDLTRVLVAFNHLDREPLTTYERRLSGPTDDLSQAGMPGLFLVPSLPGNPAYRSVWTAAFDSNRNGVADFVEPTLGLPAVPGAQPPVFADQDCTAIAAQDPISKIPEYKVCACRIERGTEITPAPLPPNPSGGGGEATESLTSTDLRQPSAPQGRGTSDP